MNDKFENMYPRKEETGISKELRENENINGLNKVSELTYDGNIDVPSMRASCSNINSKEELRVVVDSKPKGRTNPALKENSTVQELHNALFILNNRYTSTKLELEAFRGKKKKPRTTSMFRASSFLKKRMHSTQNDPRLDAIKSSTPSVHENNISKDGSSSDEDPNQREDVSKFQTALLQSQLQYWTEELDIVNKAIEQLNKDIEDKEALIPEQKSENKQNSENYDNLLKNARLNFKNKLIKLADLHTAEQLLLEKELARLQEEFLKQIQDSNCTKDFEKENENDALVMKVRWKFNLKLDDLVKTHRLEMVRLRVSKDIELDMTRKELERLSMEVLSLEQSSTSEINALKKTIDSLGKELKKERNIDSNLKRVSRASSSDISANEHRISMPTTPKSISLSAPSNCSSKPVLESQTTTKEIKILKKQMESIRTTHEWDKNNLHEALFRERLSFKETSILQSVVSSLTQSVIEKDEIIESLKASKILIEQQLLDLHNCSAKGDPKEGNA